MAQIYGSCEDRFSNLRTLLQDNIDSGQEIGVSRAVEIDGKLVVDLCGGHIDSTRSKKWQEDTIVNLWSTTKNMASLAMLVVVDRNLVKLDDTVCTYWPEFATDRKDKITVRQIMSHTSGVPAWEKPCTLEEFYDVEEANKKLAKQPPWWEPGTKSGYPSTTHGHLISEVIRRVTGKSLKQFIAEDLALPLNADFQLGVSDKDLSRMADIIPGPAVISPQSPPAASRSVMERARGVPSTDHSTGNTKGWREAEVASGNGHENG